MSSALAKINREVKRQKKLHPSMSHKAAQKKAGAAYRAGKLGRAVKKKVGKVHKKKSVGKPKKRAIRRVGARPARSNGQDRFDSKRVNITVGSISRETSKLKAQIAERIGWLEAMKMSATTVKSFKAYQKKIAELKAQYRKLE